MLDMLQIQSVPTVCGRRRSWPEWALIYLYVFRIVVVSSFLIAGTIGWFAHIQWLWAAGMCIAIGEFLESTYYIVVLKWAEQTGRLLIR